MRALSLLAFGLLLAAPAHAGPISAWRPPFAPAKARALIALLAYADGPVGRTLLNARPELGHLRRLDPRSDFDLQVAGSFLQPGAPLELLLEGQEAAEPGELSQALFEALDKGEPQVGLALQARLDALARAFVDGAASAADLERAAAAMAKFQFYWPFHPPALAHALDMARSARREKTLAAAYRYAWSLIAPNEAPPAVAVPAGESFDAAVEERVVRALESPDAQKVTLASRAMRAQASPRLRETLARAEGRGVVIEYAEDLGKKAPAKFAALETARLSSARRKDILGEIARAQVASPVFTETALAGAGEEPRRRIGRTIAVIGAAIGGFGGAAAGLAALAPGVSLVWTVALCVLAAALAAGVAAVVSGIGPARN